MALSETDIKAIYAVESDGKKFISLWEKRNPGWTLRLNRFVRDGQEMAQWEIRRKD